MIDFFQSFDASVCHILCVCVCLNVSSKSKAFAPSVEIKRLIKPTLQTYEKKYEHEHHLPRIFIKIIRSFFFFFYFFFSLVSSELFEHKFKQLNE